MDCDLLVVGAGIVGLAHAWAGAKRGWRVVVVERDAACIGASIRNFGFVTVTGQQRGAHWRRARRSRDLWAELAPRAGLRIEHAGLLLAARCEESEALLEAFLATEMGDGCERLDAAQAHRRQPGLRAQGLRGGLYSPHELRVESREAIPRIAAWLAEQHGVAFRFGEAVLEVETPRVRTARATYHAARVVVCGGAELHGLFADRWQPHALTLCQLQMLRVRPPSGFRLNAALMADLSLVRYDGYAALPEARPLLRRLSQERHDAIAHGIHLIAVQSADGTLVVGDSHHYGPVLPPFASDAVDRLILDELRRQLDLPALEVVERWTGIYPVSASAPCLVEAPDERTRLVMVTSGTGASTAFGLAEEVLAGW
ncbi:TIGR03364 family FAD-dependent oxidoreductase [Roseateles aquatilis]|uniref:TIGR03364 family FAD-dependent oxidoreductase n=1 Tax=Roseateles aquatilis TaxID=431061 RepID=A0A246J911_9BURK|nr:TIGR03364 family FAD-dependent oxidoreductase [Roseateles aquatilis]OWQ88718.1 TIGR03364 family FAD-dependent oxidoreductase [Roseateles aquatilis]